MNARHSSDESSSDRVQELLDRVLSPDEFAAALAIPLTELEREQTLALVRWFTRRYPTPVERFAYIQRARARWQRQP